MLIGRERPTMFGDSWSLAATLLQWLTEQPGPWDLDELCTRYGMRRNRMMAALMQAMENEGMPPGLLLFTRKMTIKHKMCFGESTLSLDGIYCMVKQTC